MLSERKEAIWVQSLWIERLVLWGLARQPAYRIPLEIVRERQRAYFKWRLKEAIAMLCADAELLAEVLEEILLIATAEEEIIGWRPPALEEMRIRITEPLTSCTHGAEC